MMKLFARNAVNQVIPVSDEIWESTYLSSLLRALNPTRVSVSKYFELFQTKEQVKDFIRLVLKYVKDNDLNADQEYQTSHLSRRGSYLISLVFEYCASKKLYAMLYQLLSAETK
jgi:hypothetical protein